MFFREVFLSDTYQAFNEILVELYNEILHVEERAVITGEFRDITVNEMHILDAVGIGEKKSMSAVAKDLSVTVGTLTTAVNNLLKKGYVHRMRNERDRRVVLLSLTEKGERAYLHHKKFHDEMVQSMVDGLEPEEQEVLAGALRKLSAYFRTYNLK